MADIVVAISTTSDGNMLIHADKADKAVAKNREKFLATEGISMDQTTRVDVVYEGDDYCRYRQVSRSDGGLGMRDGAIFAADALITSDPGHALFLPLADCVGASLYDPTHHILMLSHLGRHNLLQNGGSASVKYLVKHFGSDPSQLRVWLSPAPGKDVYPIWDLDNKGFKEVVFEQLQAAGVNKANITDIDIDTTKDDRYYSHSEFLKGNRREDGRYAMLAMMS